MGSGLGSKLKTIGSKIKNIFYPKSLSGFARVVEFLRLGNIRIGVKLTAAFGLIIIVSLTGVFYSSMRSIRDNMEDEAEVSTKSILAQTAYNIKTVLEDIDGLAMLISRDSEIAANIEEMNTTRDAASISRLSGSILPKLTDFRGTKSDKISFIVTSSRKGNVTVDGQGSGVDLRKEYLDTIAVKEFLESEEASFWVDPHYTDLGYQMRVGTDRIFCLFKSVYTPTSLKSVGYLQIDVKEETIGNIINDINIPYNGDVFIIGQKGNMVYNRKNTKENGFRVQELNMVNQEGKTKAEVLGKNKLAASDRGHMEILYNIKGKDIDDKGFKQRDNYITNSILNKIDSMLKRYQSQDSDDREIIGDTFKEIVNGEEMLVTLYTIKEVKKTPLYWTLVSITPVKGITDQVNNAVAWIIGIGIICFVIAIFISILITFDISSGIKVLSGSMEKIKQGNMEIEYNLNRKDEIGGLGASFRDMVINLKKLIGSVKDASDVAIESSQTVSATCEESYASIQEFLTVLTEVNEEIDAQNVEIDNNERFVQSLSDKIQIITQDFGKVNKIIFGAKELSEEGKLTVNSLKQNARQVKITLKEFTELISVLKTESTEISKITRVIKNIAKQTNLLALNATIEAARAGEAGKSFGVVARAVKKLADQSKESAFFIENKLKYITETIEKTGEVVKVSDNVICQHDSAVNDTIEKLDSIVSFMDNIYSQVNNINDSIKSIEEARGDIIGSLKNLNDSSRKNVGSINEVTVGFNELVGLIKHLVILSDDLRKLSKHLESSIDIFKV